MKKVLLFITLFTSGLFSAFGQGNYSCENTQVIIPQLECVPMVVSMANFAPSIYLIPTIENDQEVDIEAEIYAAYYSFVATSTSVIIDATTSAESGTDISLSLVNGPCSDQVYLGAGVDLEEYGLESFMLSNLVLGETYHFIISIYDLSQPLEDDEFTLCVSSVQVPANDECTTSTILTPIAFTQSVSASDLTMGAITESTLSTNVGLEECFQDDTKDVWFSFVAEANESVIYLVGVDVNDLVFSVYGGDCSELEFITCVNGGSPLSDDFDEEVELEGLVVGNTYYIRVQEYSLFINNEQAGRFGIVVINPEGLSTSTLEANTISVYPNPTKDVITVDSKVEVSTIEITNALGQVVMKVDNIGAAMTKIDTANLVDGLYVVAIYTAQGKTTRKITVAK